MWQRALVVILMILGLSCQSTSSDLQRFEYLLEDTDSGTSFVTNVKGYAEDTIFEKEGAAYMLVVARDSPDPRHELPAPPKEAPAKRKRDTFLNPTIHRGGRFQRETKAEDLEGSGTIEDFSQVSRPSSFGDHNYELSCFSSLGYADPFIWPYYTGKEQEILNAV